MPRRASQYHPKDYATEQRFHDLGTGIDVIVGIHRGDAPRADYFFTFPPNELAAANARQTEGLLPDDGICFVASGTPEDPDAPRRPITWINGDLPHPLLDVTIEEALAYGGRELAR